ncbi:phosphatase PAP2 family protein [Pseudofrankia sp. DC12]|uniref:phosphatase PAP2 family protein n=1 Tax=Pseudofrankia sp. DC12 TaxID=683315 RepID=UPI000695E4FE|nr:phosphatase PAP2 family protein [Pseudofrankia sp. DC12]
MVIATNDVAGSAQPPPRPEGSRAGGSPPAEREPGEKAGDQQDPKAKAATGRPVAAERLPRWWVELLAIASLYGLYTGIRGIKSDDLGTADQTARRLLHFEQVWHLNPEHPLNNLLLHVTALAVPACYFYATLHYILTPAVLAWMYRRNPAHYRRARSTILLTTILGLVGFWLLPTTPPRLLAGAGFHDTMAQVSDWGWWGEDASAPRGLGGLTNQYAAMPSLHCAWALWCGFLIARLARRPVVRVLGVCYPLLTTLVVMSTGNHYFLDAVGGIIDLTLAAGIVLLVGRVVPRRPSRAPGAGTGTPAQTTPQLPAQGLAAVAGRPAGRIPVGGHRLAWNTRPAPAPGPAPG